MKGRKLIVVWNSLSIGIPYQICLLATVVLAIYYPSMFAEVSLLDDRDAISGMLNTESFDLFSIFFPRSTEGGYYRPFIGLSYAIDRFWWFLDSKIMHFENILMHLFNTLMLFWVAVKLCRQQLTNKTMLPFLGAILFALHPINTESINWISGRTDPMACTFVLAALLLVIEYRKRRKVLLLIVAYAMTIFGVFAKETALGFIPASIFLLMAEEKRVESSLDKFIPASSSLLLVHLFYATIAFLSALFFTNYYVVVLTGIIYWLHCALLNSRGELSADITRRIRTIILVIAAFVLLILVFYGLRKAVFVSNIPKISDTLSVMFADMNYTIEIFMGAAGLYVKKFFIPVPLNIAIREVDPLYELFGVICFMACVYLISLKRVASALVIGGFMMLLPAFPFAFGTIAWTAYAERYDYIPSAFWILGSVSFLNELSTEQKEQWKRQGYFIVTLAVILFASATFKRNLIWQNNIDIFKDAVDKSPEFKNVRGVYISALVDKKQYEEAERQYFIAKKLHSLKYDERYDLMYASLLMIKKKYDEVEKLYSEIEIKTKGNSTALYEARIAYYDSLMFSTQDPEKIKYLKQKKIKSFEKLYSLNKSPHISYKLGQAYISVGNMDKARDAIKRAAKDFETDDPLKRNSEVLLNSIEMKIVK